MAGDPEAPGPATRRRPPTWVLAGGTLALAAAAVVLVIVLTSSGGVGPIPGVKAPPVSVADPVPYDGRSPLQIPGSEQRVLVQFSRPALGELPGARSMGAEQQRTEIDSRKREAITTRSALEANGVRLRDVVAFYRVWNGFAATVRTEDLPKLNSPGVQVRTVRRAYPATSEPVPVSAGAQIKTAGLNGQAPVAVLDTGVDGNALNGHADPGYDAVDRDRDPRPGKDPSGEKRQETSGTALASVVAEAGERVMPIRIASLRAAGGATEVSTTTDQIIAGLEHAVDPNGDQDTSDHVPVALIGVNAPYAGFSDTPEAQAIKGAAGLGTLVVAPAGNEGAAAPGSGTVGSPASAPDAVAVGAIAGPEPAPRTELKAGGDTVAQAAVLAGKPPAGGKTAGPVEATDPAQLGDKTQLRGKVVIVKAGENPGAQAAAAAAVGAAAVVLAQAKDEPLPSLPAGRSAAPVIGVTGEAAARVLELKPGSDVSFGPPERAPRSEASAPRVSPLTAQGPSAGGLPKPDLAAPSSALTAKGVAGGTAIAAARVAAIAAKYSREHPELTPKQLRAALIAGADPQNLPPDRAGAGAARTPTNAVTSNPPTQESGALDPITVKLTSTATTQLALKATGGATADPGQLTLAAGTPQTVTVRLPKPGTTVGRLEASAGNQVVASVPWLIHPDTVAPIEVGPLRVDRGGRRVRFTLGGFKRGPQTQVQVAEKLILDLVDGKGNIKRTLTFQGGARELIPAEYAYTLPSSQPGIFRVRAWAPNQDEPTVRTSK